MRAKKILNSDEVTNETVVQVPKTDDDWDLSITKEEVMQEEYEENMIKEALAIEDAIADTIAEEAWEKYCEATQYCGHNHRKAVTDIDYDPWLDDEEYCYPFRVMRKNTPKPSQSEYPPIDDDDLPFLSH